MLNNLRLCLILAFTCYVLPHSASFAQPAVAEPPTEFFAGLGPPSPDPSQSMPTELEDWYKDAIVYHLWVAAFRDSDGNGVGDVRGITESLDTLRQLGVDTLWLSPFFKSASSNRNLHGYDVIDHYEVDERLGTNADIDELIREAHERGMRLILDFVPNHLSNRHPWFVESRDPASEKRDWFVWRDEGPDDGWTEFDSQSDWHEIDGDFYYGIFWSGMPDVNHNNPEVRLELARAARHWLDRGFDGMRVDAVRYLYEDLDGTGAKSDQEDQPQSIAWFKAWREEVIDPYAELGYAKFMVAENWTEDRESLEAYLNHNGHPVFHMTLNFPLLPALTELDASLAREVWQWDATLPPDAWLGNFVSNHDLAADRPGSLFVDQPKELRAQTAWLLLGPGTPFVYYGNEIAQPQGPQRGDTKHRQPLGWNEVYRQQDNPDSIWRWHQTLMDARHTHESLRRGKARFLDTNREQSQVVALWREAAGDSTLTIFSDTSETVPDLVVTLPEAFTGKKLQSAFSGDSLTVEDDGEVKIGSLGPFETKLFYSDQL